MRTFTVDDVMALRPCNSREWHEERWAGKESLTALEILDMADAGTIAHGDATWLFTRRASDGSCACLTAKQDEAWKEVVIARAITRALEVYKAPEYTAWANAYLDGSDRTPEAAAEAAWAAWAARVAARVARAAWAAEAAEAAARAARAAEAAEAAWAAEARAAWATRAVEAAARAARAAARAAWAAWAAEAARAAEAAEEKQQCDDLRAVLLAWPE